MKQGVLLINLGTPDSATYTSVWRYLSEFLADERVITLPALLRYALLYGIILPFRTHRTLHAYQKIWTKFGSPLRFYSEQLKDNLQEKLGDNYIVSLGMRYGNPNIKSALLKLTDCQHITILPLFPHYSSAASGSALEHVLKQISRQTLIPHLTIIREFYQHPSFINAEVKRIKPYIKDHDLILFSYHGIPNSHLTTSGCKTICHDACPTPSQSNPNCYRAQCFETTRLIASQLQITPHQFATSFQSRLGKTPWIKPYTDEILSQLIKQGVKKLAIVCPSFITDCLETIEEMGMQIAQQWQSLGGEKCTLIPGLNIECDWIADLIE